MVRLPLIKDHAGDVPLPPVDHDALATKGQLLLSQALQEPANLEIAQAVTMLVSLIVPRARHGARHGLE